LSPDERRSEACVNKWIIIGVIIAVVVIASVGAVGYVVLQPRWSKPDVVESMVQVSDMRDVSDAAWIPDGLTILFVSYPNIWKIDSDGENQTCLAKSRQPVWSPDGAKIAFVTDNGLQVMNADGSGKRLLVDMAGPAPASRQGHVTSTGSPAWSPNGNMIAFEVGTFAPDPSDITGQSGTSFTQIWTVHADGSNLRQLIMDSANERILSWVPDSQSVTFVSNRDEGKGAIWASHVDGSGQPEPAEEGCLSPDGTRIAFVTEDEDLWLKDADGGNAVEVAGGSGWYYNAAWSPEWDHDSLPVCHCWAGGRHLDRECGWDRQDKADRSHQGLIRLYARMDPIQRTEVESGRNQALVPERTEQREYVLGV
jgi:Tol biopolymer transport system component